jgi:lipopolysaccharide export system ATP-binding protein
VALRAEGLVKTYGRRRVVDGVSLSVERGEIVGLLGPNGAGKTTTFYMVVGLIHPAAGGVFLGDLDMTRMPMYRRARQGVGYLAQEPSVFRKLTVEDNLRLVLEMTGASRAEREKTVDRILDELSVSRLRKSLGYQLSGGERRRVEIGRALATNPSYMLLDEPFTGIDPIAIREIQEIILHLKERNIGVLVTDHSVREMFQSIDRAYLMYEGKIKVTGTPEQIVADEDARRVYFGEDFRL